MHQSLDFIARGLAHAFLDAAWNTESLVAAGQAVLMPPAPWLEHVVDTVLTRFSGSKPPPRFRPLWKLIREHDAFREAGRLDPWHNSPEECQRARRDGRPLLRRYPMPSCRMRTAPGDWPVRPLDDVRELRRWLALPPTTLDGWADLRQFLSRETDARLQHYHRYWTAGRSPG